MQLLDMRSHLRGSAAEMARLKNRPQHVAVEPHAVRPLCVALPIMLTELFTNLKFSEFQKRLESMV